MYRFNDFLLNPATRELQAGGELVALPARTFDCLAYLESKTVNLDETATLLVGC